MADSAAAAAESAAAMTAAAESAAAKPARKADVWVQVHRQKVPCPGCGKVVTRRTLRWKHTCKRAVAVLSEAQARERRQNLEQRVLRDLMNRIGFLEKGRE